MVLSVPKDCEHRIGMTYSLDGGTCGIAGVQHIIYDDRREHQWHLSVQTQFQVYAFWLEVIFFGIVQWHVRAAGKNVPCRNACTTGKFFGKSLSVYGFSMVVWNGNQYTVLSRCHPFDIVGHEFCGLLDAFLFSVFQSMSQLSDFRIWRYGGERAFLFVWHGNR